MQEKQMKNIIGIDYGSKLAGTTVICYVVNNSLKLLQSEKKKDADQFIKSFCSEHLPDCIYLDAPLSLPLVYSQASKADNYFYRQADIETQAMSPMFLGGLTARAIKLKSQLKPLCFEAYPKMLVSMLKLEEYYKSDISKFLKSLDQHYKICFPKNITNWHQVDAILAFIIGLRHQQGVAKTYGSTDEGVIFV